MRLVERRTGWTPQQWGDAGYNDAMHCIAARYNGDDWTDDMCQQYIIGYRHGQETANRTAPCDRLRSSKPYEWVEQSNLEPGLISENWKSYFDENGWMLATISMTLLMMAVLLWWIWRIQS